jgi:Uma2 family endonuclease
MTTRHVQAVPPPEARPEVYRLYGVSRETHELLLRDTAGDDVRLTYDKGHLTIDRGARGVGFLEGIGWETYEHLLDDLDGQHLRLTYDKGRLSIVLPTPRHDKIKRLIGRMIEALSLELHIPLSSFGSATWRSAPGMKGVEADESYYIQSERLIRGKDDIDLSVDPPPDLVVEVEISHPPLARLPVYAGLGVPEIWVYRGDGITVLVLRDGKYVPDERSLAFPWLRPADIDQFLAARRTMSELELIERFLSWLRTLPRPNQQA